MKTNLIGALSGALLLVAASAQGTELVKNGNFETAGTDVQSALYWTKPDLGTNADTNPNNYARVGSYSNFVGDDPYGNVGAPHGAGNGTGTQILTRTAWLGGLSPRTSIIQQDIDTSAYKGGSASLTFKLVYEDEDIAAHVANGVQFGDFVYVDFGGTRLKTVDMGAAYQNYVQPNGVVRQGGVHFWTLETPTIDLSPYLDGTTKTLKFTVINDASSTYGNSSAWFDNVSIQAAPVPEPTTFAALTLGTVVLIRRRRR